MTLYTVQTAFDLLKTYKLTTHVETVRRWLREGKIKAIPPKSRKEGWLIEERDLLAFIRARMPDDIQKVTFHTRDVAKASDSETVRAGMWWELVTKNIFEDRIDVKKMRVRECVVHLGLSSTFETYAWETIQTHKRGYATPRIPYLLEAALFDGPRILLDTAYESKEEQVLFAVLEYLRKQKTTA